MYQLWRSYIPKVGFRIRVTHLFYCTLNLYTKLTTGSTLYCALPAPRPTQTTAVRSHTSTAMMTSCNVLTNMNVYEIRDTTHILWSNLQKDEPPLLSSSSASLSSSAPAVAVTSCTRVLDDMSPVLDPVAGVDDVVLGMGGEVWPSGIGQIDDVKSHDTSKMPWFASRPLASEKPANNDKVNVYACTSVRGKGNIFCQTHKYVHVHQWGSLSNLHSNLQILWCHFDIFLTILYR